MGDENPIRTLGDYSRPSHEGYRNTIELPDGNNVVPLQSDTIRLVQNGCSFHRLGFEDSKQHLKDFLKLVDSLDLDVTNKERKRLRLFQFSLCDQAINWLERLPAGSISTWEDLTTYESFSEAWTRFKNLLQKVAHHDIDLWLQIQIFYDHVSFHLKCQIGAPSAPDGKLRDKNAEEYWEIIENLSLYDHEGWNDPRHFAKPVKAISLPHDTPRMPYRRLLELEDQINYLLKGSRTTPKTSSTHIPQEYNEEINDRMAEIFGLLKEPTTSRTPEKVLVREEARHPITKHVNAISLVKMEKEMSVENNEVVDKNIIELGELDVVEHIELVDMKE
ncbi:hypothetical protein Tco_0630213 [Tanacetum coccineum]